MDENRKYKDKAILEEIKKVIEKRENDTDIEMHIEIKDQGAVIEVVKSSNKKLKEENLEVTSEFLEMAARMVYIKTVSLLPVHEEADRLAEELRGELTEYRDCQLMAGKLAEQANGFNFFSREPQEIDVDMTYTRLHEPSELYKAYMAAVGKGKRKLPPPVEAFSGIIAKKIVSVSSRFSYILRKLGRNKKQKFISFFERSTSRSEMVATFMAMLALVKSKKVEINGDGGDAEVTLITDRR